MSPVAMKKNTVSIHGISFPVYSMNTLIIGSGAAALNAAVNLIELGQKDIAIATDRWGGGTSNNAGSAKQPLYELSGAWKGPFKGLTVIYTGGIHTGNLREIVNFDPNGIFCGSALTKSIEDPERVRDEGEKWLGIIHGSDVS